MYSICEVNTNISVLANHRNWFLYCPILSIWSTLIFSTNLFLHHILPLHQHMYDFKSLSHRVYPKSPRYIINKWDKVLMASKWCGLSRNPNINVNIIKKTFWGWVEVPNYTFVFLSRISCLLIFNFQVDAPFNNFWFANTPKEFKPTYSSLICYNMIESSFTCSEAAKFHVTALSFKWYKLRRMPLRTTNEPLNILRTPFQESFLGSSLSKLQLKSNFSATEVHISHFSTLVSSHQTTWCELYLSLQSGMCVRCWMTPSLHLVFKN